MKINMSRSIWSWLVIAGLLIGGLQSLCVADDVTSPYVVNEYIIRVEKGASVRAVSDSIAQLGGMVVKALPLPDTYLVRMGVPANSGVSGTIRNTRVATTPWVIKSFAPNFIYSKHAVPNDPYWTNEKLWGLKKINMPRAWDTNKGSSSVTVAVIDSGVANHPDLAGRVLTEKGYDFVDNDADASNDYDGHGTHVAGTIAAQGDNNIGVVGVCWDGVKILPIRFLDGVGNGTTDNAILSLDHAFRMGADVVNMSWGQEYGFHDDELQAEIEVLASAGLILCASAGNSGFSGNPYVGEPASYPECIAVAACGPNDNVTWYSSWGPGNEVDITAPGGDQVFFGLDAGIYSTSVGWMGDTPVYDYEAQDGTSMACPHVSGAAALLLSSGVPADEVRSRLEGTARRIAGMDKKKYGNGILDVAAAISSGTVFITKPVKGSTVSANPDVQINVRGIRPDSIAVYVDYVDANRDGVPDNLSLETPVIAGVALSRFLNQAGTAVAFNWKEVAPHIQLSPGLHWIYVTATTTVGGQRTSDWGVFEVTGRIIPAGQHLCAFPYGFMTTNPDGTTSISTLPSDILMDAATSQPLDFRIQTVDRAQLHRWSTPQGGYFAYVTGLWNPNQNVPRPDDMAWLYPYMILSNWSTVPTGGGFLANDNSRALQFPAGAGFWLTLQRDAYINNAYTEINAPQGFSMYLYKGWNIIGNPYTRSIPLAAIKLTYQGKTRTLREDQLARPRWVDDTFYAYESDSGYKIERQLLQPYQGYWVRALVGGTSPNEQLIMTVY
ncbi:MAG: S8 family serine peptidase [Armatimonadota bacterium]